MRQTVGSIELIVAADEPACFFTSIKAAEDYLEWIDVDNGVYPIAYDRDGNVYHLKSRNMRVIVARDEGAPSDPKGLNALLRKKLASDDVPIESEDNEFLLSLCVKYIDA